MYMYMCICIEVHATDSIGIILSNTHLSSTSYAAVTNTQPLKNSDNGMSFNRGYMGLHFSLSEGMHIGFRVQGFRYPCIPP